MGFIRGDEKRRPCPTVPTVPAALRTLTGPSLDPEGSRDENPEGQDEDPERASTAGRQAERGAAPKLEFDSLELLKLCFKAAEDKKMQRPVMLDIRGFIDYTDFILIGSGSSDRHIQAIALAMEEEIHRRGFRTIGIEGFKEGRWVLIDYGGVIVHIFNEHYRELYDLEGLWSDAPQLKINPE